MVQSFLRLPLPSEYLVLSLLLTLMFPRKMVQVFLSFLQLPLPVLIHVFIKFAFNSCFADAAQKLRRGHTVSRPPSSHITRVDEESSASDSGGRSGGSRLLRPGSVGISPQSVETVDRGVGPTPLPGPPSVADYPHVPNFLLPHFIDPRNGLLDSPYGACSPSRLLLFELWGSLVSFPSLLLLFEFWGSLVSFPSLLLLELWGSWRIPLVFFFFLNFGVPGIFP